MKKGVKTTKNTKKNLRKSGISAGGSPFAPKSKSLADILAKRRRATDGIVEDYLTPEEPKVATATSVEVVNPIKDSDLIKNKTPKAEEVGAHKIVIEIRNRSGQPNELHRSNDGEENVDKKVNCKKRILIGILIVVVGTGLGLAIWKYLKDN